MLSRIAVRRVVPRLGLVRTYATPVEFKQPEHDPQLGDYPQLPAISNQRRPPKGWWDNQERKNFGETVSLGMQSRRGKTSISAIDLSSRVRILICRSQSSMKFSLCGPQMSSTSHARVH
jgi:hypothetical protein